ncbi:DUF998 domain-containing protein [Amycolatopsis azurea]|uniref:DUF998 domain-containing protein n=1 Tax=Amycolatopsis azurea DSM 43854 TaxID=1238180 RepID=M2Q4V8_9PSEU|nr:DUF998 domain-containing protein [Amycolatopsis azurea]EMD21821.1 hypothetical protein C791_0809 [Amycolatopsis azurea DSM 43854]OOC08126.1 hypothetical protein B0293_04435 [Amycolatopsis azurea DSM 43854]
MVTAAVNPVRRPSERLLLAGTFAGPIFFTSSIIQMLTREGFDITRHPLSQLSTGSLGWLQVVTFVVAGLGVLALAAGIRHTLTDGVGRRAAPVCTGIFGAGLVVAGLFTADSENGFPVGTPDAPVAEMSWHSIVHSAAAAVAFTALALAAIVLAVRHARARRVRPAVLSGAAALVLLVPMTPEFMSIQIAVNGVVAFAWTTVVALSLRTDR